MPLKALLVYELRHIFTWKRLLGVACFLGCTALFLVIISELNAPLKTKLMNQTYIQSQYLYYSTLIFNYSIIGWSILISASLFIRGEEDIALLMRTSRTKMGFVKIIVSMSFIVYLLFMLQTINHAMVNILCIKEVLYMEVIGAGALIGIYYVSLMSVISLLSKSPRVFIVLLPLIFIVDTLSPIEAMNETPLNAGLGVLFPMVGVHVETGVTAPSLWVTLMLSGLFISMAIYIMKEKAY